jgi:acyl-CoA thioester hydrolase
MENNYQIFEFRYQIKEHDLDTFGHVNNAQYLVIYEMARWDFITENGYGLDQVQTKAQGPVILELNVKYKKELKNREWITIKSKTKAIKGKLMFLEQEMIKDDGSIASEALFTVGFFDLKVRKLINPSQEWLHSLGIE